MRRNFLRSLAAVTASAFCLKPSEAKQAGVITTMIHGEDVYFARDGKVFKIENKCTTTWCQNGFVHREDGPAIIWWNGTKSWYRNGKLHREDGPAVEYANGHKEWWIEGKRHREDAPAIEFADGEKQWFQNGELHREDGPSVEKVDGSKVWHRNGWIVKLS